MKLKTVLCLAVVGILCAGSVDARFVDKRLRKGGFGIKAGLIGPTTFSVDGRQYENKFGVSGGIFFEFPLSSRMMLGLSGDLHNIILKELEDNEPFLDISLGPKYLIVVESSNIALKPGFGIGFGYLGPIGTDDRRIDRTAYLTWRVGSEVLFLTRQRYAFVGEIQLAGTALGRNRDVEITTNPAFLLRVGFMY